MKTAVQWFSWCSGLLLQALVVSRMLRGPVRRFPFLFGYCVSILLATVVEIALRIDQDWKKGTAEFYWLIDNGARLLTFCTVIALIHSCAPADKRGRLLRLAAPAAVGFTAISFLIHRTDTFNMWMTLVSRDLSVAAVVLDMVLWLVLLASPDRDRTVLLISGGFGLQFCGSAIGQSLRQMWQISRSMVMVGNLVMVFSHLLCFYVWWRALRPELEPVTAKAGADPGLGSAPSVDGATANVKES